MSQSTIKLKPLTTIWECSKIEKSGNEWKCLWCNKTFKGVNHNRALSHVSGKRLYGATGISQCEGRIDQTFLNRYCQLADIKTEQRSKKESKSSVQALMIQCSQNAIVSKIQENKSDKQNKKRNSKDSYTSSISPMSHSPIDVTNQELSSVSDCNQSSKKPRYQTLLNFNNNQKEYVCCEEKVDVAIANLIISKGLPFSLAEDVLFQQVINVARNAPVNYQPPSRDKISGEFLEMLHNQYVEKCHEKLKINVMFNGLSIMGDGATIKKSPLMNYLVSSPECPVFVAKILDATPHLIKGGNKNCEYIERSIRPILQQLDPTKKLFDVAFFDGATNVQKAGQLLAELYPRISTIHGCEHVMSLFFSDLLRKTPLKVLVQLYWVLFGVFGSGSTHMSYAIFANQAYLNNNSKKIGLIRAAGTRFGGWFYSFHRMIRLKSALYQTVAQPEWIQKVKFDKKPWLKPMLESIIHDEQLWDCLYAIVIILFPCIKCLRLADSNKPGMDKMFYFVRQTTIKLHTLAQKIDECFDEEHFLSLINPQTYKPKDSRRKKTNKDDNDILEMADLEFEIENDSSDVSDEEEEEEEEDFTDDISDKITSSNELLNFLIDNSPAVQIDDDSLLSQKIMAVWKNRAKDISSDFVVAGWLLCVDLVIYEDAKQFNIYHQRAFARVSEKLFAHIPATERENKLNVCMEQFQKFRHRQFPFDRDEIWASEYVIRGESYKWHAKFTHEHCPELAFVACRITSKVLGIGSCERSWADTKLNKSGKRVNISSRNLEKQSILYGAHSIQNAKCSHKDEYYWGAEDLNDVNFNAELEQYLSGIQKPLEQQISRKEPVRSNNTNLFDLNYRVVKKFYTYIEHWEHKALKSDNPSCKYKLLSKYGGMRYIWPEDSADVKKYASYICDETMVYEGRKGWCAVLVPKGMTFNWDHLDLYEKEAIGDSKSLHDCIAITEQHPDVEVYDEDDKLIDPRNHHLNYFGGTYPSWDSFPDADENTNPSRT